MKQESINIVGARTNNLKNINVTIPKNAVTVITGLSGSGKSSLAFDTIFAEGQRRYVESLSSYVRQFMSDIERPDFDYIEGLAPAVAIDQKTSSRNPRSTVATTTEIYDFLRLLFSRVGVPFCPNCKLELSEQSHETIAEQILIDFTVEENVKAEIYIVSVKEKKGEHKYQLKQAKKAGVLRVKIDTVLMSIEEAISLEIDKNQRHTIELLVGSIDFPVANPQSREVARVELIRLIQKAFKLSNGLIIVEKLENEKIFRRFYSTRHACSKCGLQFPEIEPRLFSFNNPEGACEICQGLGVRLVAERELVIPNPRLTIAEGAIRPWSRTTSQSSWYQKTLNEISTKYEFSLDTPVEKLSEDSLKVLLYGEAVEEPDRFEGVLPNLERRYRETDSEYLRQEIEKYMVERVCDSCHGQRLRREVLSILINNKNIIDITSSTVEVASQFFHQIQLKAKNELQGVAEIISKEIASRLNYLLEVGLGYLTLDRTTSTLAGGEAQRIRLANQLGSGLTGVVYILDEPSIGLHARDHEKLLKTIAELKNRGNTVIVVEHDRDTMLDADYIIDMGPGAGEQGGEIIAQGTPEEIKNNPASITGQYLANIKTIKSNSKGNARENWLEIKGACGNNLKNIDVPIPLNQLICVTGVSGSGKSTLIEDTLAVALAKQFHHAQGEPAKHSEITGTENIDNIININQSPIGRTPRSNPATYTGVLGPIRDLFANTEDAQQRGYDPSRFSFNLRGGRCENCRGDGQIKIEMNFLPDVYVPCNECRGKRFNHETIEVKYRGKDISEVLQMTVDEASKFFTGVTEVTEKLQVLQAVGLGYIRLGQSATTLSGGEAQRIKLAAELSKRETGKTLYILDEPTTGLHFEDINRLLAVLNELVSRGNTVIIIEHNLDVIKQADWIIDLGPDGGNKGGELVAAGTPKDIQKIQRSITGQFLAKE